MATLHAVACSIAPAPQAASGYEWPVAVCIVDAGGEAVFEATVRMWVSPR